MSDSEDEILKRRKQCGSLLDSEADEVVSKCSSGQSTSPNSAAESSSKKIPNHSEDFFSNCKKSEQLSSSVPNSETSCNETYSISQNDHQSHSNCSTKSDHSSQSSSSQLGSVIATKRKSFSDSSDSDSSTSSTLSNHSSTSRRKVEKSSILDSNYEITQNDRVILSKSSLICPESDSCSEMESKAHDTSISFDENASSIKFQRMAENLSEQEETVKPKKKKYQLLSDDDFSENEENSSVNNQNICSELSDSLTNSDPANKLMLQKQKRKLRLEKLNEIKKKEMLDKSGNSSSDSECESREIFNNSKKKLRVNLGGSSNEGASLDSGNDTKKHTKKRYQTSQSNKKSKKSQKVDPLLEIKSKTQKMIRDNRISLPYHQPKKRSLDEFLQRRKNSLSMPLKPTNDLLHVVSEHLLKREKEVAFFYKSESDHSDNDTANVAIVDQTTNNSNENLPKESEIGRMVISEDIDTAPAKNNNPITEIDQDLGILEETPVETNNFDSNQLNDSAELTSGTFEFCAMNRNVPEEKASIAEHVLNDEAFDFENIETKNKDLENSKEESNSPEESLNNIQLEDKLTETVESFETNTCSPIPNCSIAEKTYERYSNRTEESPVKEVQKTNGEKIEQDNCDSGSTFEKCPQNVTVLPDSEDFDLMIQDSSNDVEKITVDSVNVSSETKTDLRSQKLALLSRLNISLRPDIKLQASPDELIEFETSALSECEIGIFELKKKFAFHTTIRNKPARKSSNKVNIVRTETDSGGDVINVVKETLEFSCGETMVDTEKEHYTTPGTKHQNFRERIWKTLVAKKQDKWQEYQNEKSKLYDTQSDEEDYSADDEYNDKPDFEHYHPEDELDDEELEENDIELKDKKSKKNDFVDDEAEVSFDEDENLKESNVEDGDSEKEAEEEKSEEEAEIDEEALNKVEDADEDSDAELLNSNKDEKSPSQPFTTNSDPFKKPLSSQIGPLFKYNTTGIDLENKVLGLESIFMQKNQITDEDTGSQLFEICSGKFATQVDRLNSSNLSDSGLSYDLQNTEDSQNINLSLQDTNDGFNASLTGELENRNAIFLSDESDTEELFTRRKKLMQLQDSDDEADPQMPTDDEDEVKCDDDDDNEGEPDNILEDDEEFAYNSEEEIIPKAKATEFFENEAELSESEWGSEDENEQNLDELEKEAGDDDVLDEDELKEELGKIHMRQLLDDDQQDVRMLKEMLLEDGELHSESKRERKFQWTNLDDNGFFSKMANDSDEEALNEEDEEETDSNWRKIRHEREMYISQQEKRDSIIEEAESDTNDLLPMTGTEANRAPENRNKSDLRTRNISSPDSKLPFKNQFKCGSFLSRSKMLLNRIALTVGECKENVSGRAKNSRNFVFAAVSPERKLPNDSDTKTEKRKISSKSIMASKKLKLTPPTNQHGLLAQLALRE